MPESHRTSVYEFISLRLGPRERAGSKRRKRRKESQLTTCSRRIFWFDVAWPTAIFFHESVPSPNPKAAALSAAVILAMLKRESGRGERSGVRVGRKKEGGRRLEISRAHLLPLLLCLLPNQPQQRKFLFLPSLSPKVSTALLEISAVALGFDAQDSWKQIAGGEATEAQTDEWNDWVSSFSLPPSF